MAVVIRLARCGSKHKPKYRLMVADSRRYVTGKYLDNLGYYIPKVGVQQESINIDLVKINDWLIHRVVFRRSPLHGPSETHCG